MVDLLTEQYPHLCDVEANQPEEENELGQPVEHWGAWLSDVPCRFADAPKSTVRGRYETTTDKPLLFVPCTYERGGVEVVVQINELETRVVNLRASDGRGFPGVFNVRSVTNPAGEFDHYEVELEQVRPG